MKFLLDMPISIKITGFLRDKGYEVVHLREEDLQQLTDGEIFTKALSEKMIILTMDLDFGRLLAFSKGRLPSVIIFRLEDERPKIIRKLLEKHLPALLPDLEKGAVVVIEEEGIRVRRLPI